MSTCCRNLAAPLAMDLTHFCFVEIPTRAFFLSTNNPLCCVARSHPCTAFPSTLSRWRCKKHINITARTLLALFFEPRCCWSCCFPCHWHHASICQVRCFSCHLEQLGSSSAVSFLSFIFHRKKNSLLAIMSPVGQTKHDQTQHVSNKFVNFERELLDLAAILCRSRDQALKGLCAPL